MSLPRNRTMPPAVVMPVLVYADVDGAAEWLCQAFGFAQRWRAHGHRSQLVTSDGGAVVLAEGSTAGSCGAHSVMVRVANVDSHHARALEWNARILSAPADYPYGERQYTVEDPGGHRWTFSQSIADVAPEDWGGDSGPGMSVDG